MLLNLRSWLVAGCCVLAAQASPVLAQVYPAKAVRIVVPYATGGSTDIIGRLVAQKLGEAWGQPVLVDNRAGGGTTIGTSLVAKAAPDGYTILLTAPAFTINPAIVASLPYDTPGDFLPVTLINTTPLVMAVNAASTAQSVGEFITQARANPAKLNFGSSGPGGANHLAGELFNVMAGVKLTHIPYKSNAAALTDLVGGRLDVVFFGHTATAALIKAGKLRVLAVTSLKRGQALPDVPTVDELGLKGFDVIGWNGLNVPAKTPRAVVNVIHGSVVKIISAADVRRHLETEGSDPVGSTPEQFGQMLQSEVGRWKKLVAEANIKVE